MSEVMADTLQYLPMPVVDYLPPIQPTERTVVDAPAGPREALMNDPDFWAYAEGQFAQPVETTTPRTGENSAGSPWFRADGFAGSESASPDEAAQRAIALRQQIGRILFNVRTSDGDRILMPEARQYMLATQSLIFAAQVERMIRFLLDEEEEEESSGNDSGPYDLAA